MKISPAERLILSMLCDISRKLKIDDGIDPKLVQSAILGHSWGLEWEYDLCEKLHDDIGSDDPIVKETADILQMYAYLNASFDKLSAKDKAKCVSAGYDKKNLEFEGFDGNYDRHYGVATFMVNDLGRFSEYKGKDLNSHSRGSLPAYKRMLPAYHSALEAKSGSLLDADQIVAIASARKP